MQKKLHFLLSLMLLCATTVMAQVTTSSMSGKVTLQGTNEEIVGATIQATHEPSGTRYATVTNADGRFNIQGMRTGGPYKVTVSYIGYQSKTYKGIQLQLGEAYNLNAQLSEDATVLGEVVVSATASKFAAEKTGASTNINNSQIVNLPTVNRSITDVTRLSPYGGNGMFFAGSDGRTANFTVDGANFNNNFGLSSKLPGGGNPISIDAIDELQVVISPFDVRQTNFIGGGVNAITKSGTNTFKGSAYIYHRNENLRGDAVDKLAIDGARNTDRSTTYGFTLGGPIIKNKLFFFVNGETIQTPTIANRWRASSDGVANPNNYISRTTIADMERVSQFVATHYGYDTGSYTNFPADETNYKILARLDWNINNMHHLALRYNYTKNRGWNAPNMSSMDGGPSSAFARTSDHAMAFANSMYAVDNLVHSFTFDLNSRISEKLSNQFLATYSKLDDQRFTNSSEFPFIDILDGTGTTSNYMSLGEELFTHNNAVHNKIWNIKDDVTYFTGNHKITAGMKFEHQMADNSYMRNGTGYYRYASVNDFLTGAAPEIVCLTYGYNGEKNPISRVQFNTLGIYGQDEWQVNNKLKLTYGVRFDGLFFNNNDLMRNNAIYNLDYNGRHIDTGKWPSSSLTISPRIGFTYDVLGNKTLKVRGGTGFFSGRLPLVFFTNMPTNSGMVQYQAQLNARNGSRLGYAMSNFAGGLVTDANGKATIEALYNKITNMTNASGNKIFPSTISPETGSVPSQIAAVSPKFKMPQVWKTSLAVDYQIPVSFPFSVTAEGIYNKTINAVKISDWSVPNVGGFARFNGIDNRPIYAASASTNPSAFVLENTSKGYGWSLNLSLNAQPAEWVSLMAAYTHTVSKEITGMPGSNAKSAFTYIPTVEGANYIKLHNSQYVTPDRFVASASIHDKSGNHYSLIYETWRGGYNYGYMTTNDVNGDGYLYDAIYIPTDAQVANGDFRFRTNDDRDRFMDFVHANKSLKNHQGEYAEPYSVYTPWVHRIDFSYKHDFKLNFGNTKHTLQLSFDIKNLMNLFNSSWGVMKYLNPKIGQELRVMKYEGADANGYATWSTPSSINGSTQLFVPQHTIGQCWNASIGIKYIFN